MDCTSARLLLHFQRPAELDAVELSALNEHIEGCAECAALARLETESDRSLASAMRAIPVPVKLREHLLGELQRRRPPYPWPKLAAAAVVLLALGISGWMWATARTTFDRHTLIAEIAKEPTQVDAWFADEGLPTVVPRHFNYAYLDSYDVKTVQGRRVPHLLFHFPGSAEHPGAALAHVYVISEESFVVGDEPSHESTSNHTVEYQRRDGFLYVIIYTGGSLAPFSLRLDV